ncbi:hypothetical protein [Pseudarthrobacter sp. PH31-O2]|uniref:hypothetical protein n=1 Tax=Pseudarthrobacter sp. PH31-O2 TaxID=3046206 RepID=UPI0024BAEB0D|nr:hypothetical protein [Pseudarthrobacter sp. PH31-O2]MDJ0354409.1 hypothetical protein [Pseudarthrobacter sp. PH31-O2]
MATAAPSASTPSATPSKSVEALEPVELVTGVPAKVQIRAGSASNGSAAKPDYAEITVLSAGPVQFINGWTGAEVVVPKNGTFLRLNISWKTDPTSVATDPNSRSFKAKDAKGNTADASLFSDGRISPLVMVKPGETKQGNYDFDVSAGLVTVSIFDDANRVTARFTTTV